MPGISNCLQDESSDREALCKAAQRPLVTTEPAKRRGFGSSPARETTGNLTDRDLALLQTYWPSERLAIVRFRARMAASRHQFVDLADAIRQWEEGQAKAWRQEKMRLDGQKQLEEIERHKYIISQEAGYDVGWERAADDWIECHAAAWRVWWEDQPSACP